jgi:hypothetical protein
MNTVVVAGALANKAGSAGEAWVRMSWVRGLERLGLDVRFVEELAEAEIDHAAVSWFRAVSSRFGLEGRATLLRGVEAVVGPTLDELESIAADATLVNISGHLRAPTLMSAFQRRVLVDLDPAFTQFWHVQGIPGANLEGHDLYFTVGELIGTPASSIPTAGLEWHAIRPPVVLDDWPQAPPDGLDRFTTIGSWRGPFGPIEHDGGRYGLKAHEFRKLIDLPRRSDQSFELALDIDPADSRDLEALLDNGWRVVDPREVAGDPDVFRDYIQGSGAEFSVAQGIYVETNSGWFSDRTTRYLASGRPALVQDTGFSQRLAVGDGLVAYRTPDEAVKGSADIAGRYAEHCEAARRLAEDQFDSDRVLARFCEQVGIS